MNRVAPLLVAAAFVLIVNPVASLAIGPPNPTDSDLHFNTAGGANALANVDNAQGAGGTDNTAFGYEALLFNTTGDSNTACGALALRDNTTGRFNTACGAFALQHNTAINNTASGAFALQINTTGIDNTASGVKALNANTTGSFNTASGAFALTTNSTGINNTASGAFALLDNTSGLGNMASGVQALQHNTTGDNNTASGLLALSSNFSGHLNTAAGFQALDENIAGNNNTAVGAKALKKSLGTKNIGIGYQAGVSLVTGNNNIFIGNQGAGDESQTIRIGTAQTQTFIAGISTTKMGAGEIVAIDPATGQLGFAAASSARYKQDIAPMGSRSEGVFQLRPVTFAYKDDAGATMHYGLVAEEVAAVYPQLVTYAPTGEVRTVKYQELIPMLLNELQRERQDLGQALQMLQHQQQELSELRALVEQGRRAEAVIPSATVAVGGPVALPR